MAFNVNEIKAQLTGGGARQSLFQVQFNNPGNAVANLKVPFMVRTANLPESTLGNITVGYFGRKIKVPGDRTFAEWTITVINDENFIIRNAMESWMNAINSHTGNLRAVAANNPSGYSADALVTQYSKTNTIIKQYKFVGLFPIDVGVIELDWGSNDTIEEYGITFDYQWWEAVPVGGTSGSTT